MTRGRCQGWAVVAVVSAILCGCRSHPTPSYPNWEPEQPPYAPQSGSHNAFDGYALAAADVESRAEKYLDRVFFTPGQKKAVLDLTARAISQVATAQSNPCKFEFVSRAPFDRPPYQRGWRLIGRSLTWKVENACALKDFDGAISNAVIGTRFGFDLTGGSATDASLGLETANDIRKAIAPSLGSMGAGQLERLARGIKSALIAKPPISNMIQNEHKNMRRAVQLVQDAYAKDSFDQVKNQLGPDARDAISYLKGLKPDDEEKRPGYFEGFVAESDEEARWLTAVAQLPVVDRSKTPEPDLAKFRPWKRFAKAFFTAPVPILEVNDATMARTRLLILTAEILKQVKVRKVAPQGLGEFSVDMRTDPYTGRPFVYSSSGTNFALYSVGADFEDNGGDTDDSYTKPDLTLERPQT